jgi:hypothetical protein
MDMQELLCPTINKMLNPDEDNPQYAYVIIVCQANGTMVGGDTRVLTNMDPHSAMRLVRAAGAAVDSTEGHA